jgi:hypothetical protein
VRVREKSSFALKEASSRPVAARHVEKNGATLKRNGAKNSATRRVPLMKRIIWKVIDGAYTEFPDPTQHLGEPSCGRKHKASAKL